MATREAGTGISWRERGKGRKREKSDGIERRARWLEALSLIVECAAEGKRRRKTDARQRKLADGGGKPLLTGRRAHRIFAKTTKPWKEGVPSARWQRSGQRRPPYGGGNQKRKEIKGRRGRRWSER
ncbi:hypothetical protein KM043_006380 [Ampulex compressa]|nr:hypothetical protein KM043_006380 [Ampulex compressa]